MSTTLRFVGMAIVLGASATTLTIGCRGAQTDGPIAFSDSARPIAVSSATVASSAMASASSTGPHVTSTDKDPALYQVLLSVSQARGLPIKSPVSFTYLGREQLLAETTKKLNEEVPPSIVEAQGETLRLLGLAPVDYDFEKGILALITARVAGFYDPDKKTMFLLDDLGDSQEDATLPHELAHALQDQTFGIGDLLHFKEGQSDRSTAIQLLVEGDATAAGFEVAYGSPVIMEESEMRAAFLVPTMLSSVGAATPPVIVASLISPYVEGHSFVRALLDHNGWKAVDSAFRKMPDSTEQVLHPAKYFAREMPQMVSAPPIGSLGEGYKAVLTDVNGELGLRLMLEQWMARSVAYDAAAGWGGDTYVIAKNERDDGALFAGAFVTRMDTIPDAADLGRALDAGLGKDCRERADLGPISHRVVGKDVIVVAGPYLRPFVSGKKTLAPKASSSGDCTLSKAWIKEISARLK